MSTTLNGLASIRAFDAQGQFVRQYYIYQDDHSSAWFVYICASRYLALVLDWFCVAYIIVVTIVLMVFSDNIGAGSAGLVLSSGALQK